MIEQFEARVKGNPRQLQGYVMLAHLNIRRARETGDFAGYDRAEAAVRRALALNKNDVSAQVNLAVVLCAQHKFAEGLRLARDLYRKNPNEHTLLSLIGDAHLELGDYAAADKAYRELQKKNPRYTLSSRLARLAELKGQTDEALKQMEQAAKGEINTSITPQGRRLVPLPPGRNVLPRRSTGQGRGRPGRVAEDESALPAGAGLPGQSTAGQGKYDAAIKLYVQAVGLYPDLAMLADLGDLYAKTGKDFLARLNYDKLEAVGRKQDVYARELSLFYSDHDRKPAEAVALAKKDLEVRKDVYAYNALAWACARASDTRRRPRP